MVSIKWCMESAGELSHNNPKRKNGFGYGCLIIYMSLTPLPVTLALSFLKTESLDPPPCRLGSLDSFDLVWEKKGSVLFWPSVQERLVTSWLLKHPSPSLKKRKKKNLPRFGESCQMEFPFISMSVAQLVQCLSELCCSNSAIFSHRRSGNRCF